MIFKAFESIKKHNMLSNIKKVVVGFSGGADSIALLHFLYFYVSEKRSKFDVIAVHVNHGIRGKEATCDENFAKDFCDNLGIKIIIRKIDVLSLSKKLGIGVEEAGRKARYEIFESLAQGKNDKIATAHTLSDNCETVIMNLARGAGLLGLCGIPPVRGKIVRPLIGVSRAEIEYYCRENNLGYVNDSSNFILDYTRNKIRHNIIPELKKINPSFEKAISKTVDFAMRDEAYLKLASGTAINDICTPLGYNAKKIADLPDALQSRVAAALLKKMTLCAPEAKHIKLFLSMANGALKRADFCGGVTIINQDGYLAKQNPKNVHNSDWSYPFARINILTEIKINIIIKVISFEDYLKQKNGKPLQNIWFADFDAISPKSVFRPRKAGDKIILPRRNVTKSVKKLMNEMKIPLNVRNDIPLLADGSEVIWMDKVGVSKNYLPLSHTKNVAVIIKETMCV